MFFTPSRPCFTCSMARKGSSGTSVTTSGPTSLHGKREATNDCDVDVWSALDALLLYCGVGCELDWLVSISGTDESASAVAVAGGAV